MFFSLIVNHLLLPPGLFILIFLVASWHTNKWRKISLATTILFYLLSIPPVSHLLLGTLENPYDSPPPETTAEAIVVLGGGIVEGSSNLPLSNGTLKRSIFALLLGLERDIPLIFSGKGRDNINESEAFLSSIREMEKALHHPFPRSDRVGNHFMIITERQSRTTMENALYTSKLLSDNGLKNPRILLVTSAYHMKRAQALFQRQGCIILPAATDFRVPRKKEYSFYAFLPSMSALEHSYLVLHEYYALLYLVLFPSQVVSLQPPPLSAQ